MNLALSTAAMAAVPMVPTVARAQPAPVANGESPADIARREVEEQRQILLGDGGTDQRTRDEAARRLLQAGRVDLLTTALNDPRNPPQIAAARAVADTEFPPPALVRPLIGLLPTRNERTTEHVEAVTQALVNYKDDPLALEAVYAVPLNALAPPPQRAKAVAALGRLNDKRTASKLIDLLRSSDLQIVADTAADALIEMTGRAEFGNDVSQWVAWWRQQAGKADAVFRDERLRERFGELRLIAREAAAAGAAIERATIDAIRLIPADDRDKRDGYLLGRLRDQSPIARTAGAGVVITLKSAGEPVGPPVLEQLRLMVGDSSRDVRLRVAQALRNINDPGAVRPILAQLQRERDPQVKAGLIEAIAPTNDVSVVPELIRLVGDPGTPYRVVESAAAALASLGREVAKNDAQTRQVADVLADALRRTAGERAPRLRERVVEAMIALHDPRLIDTLQRIPRDAERNTPAMRINAIKALAEMPAGPLQRPGIAATIASTLEADRDPGVKLEAAKALGAVGEPENAAQLVAAMKNETDPGIKEAAWRSLVALFPRFDWEALRLLADRDLSDDPEKNLTAKLVVNDKLIAIGAAQATTLAGIQEEVGTLYVRVGQPEKAIPFLLAALNFNDRLPGGKVEAIQERTYGAYAGAEKYADVIDFANGRIAKNPANEETMARLTLRHLEQLRDKADWQRGADFFKETKRLNLRPNVGHYPQSIAKLGGEITSKIMPYLHRLFAPLGREMYAADGLRAPEIRREGLA
ncbi:MAG TPA: HEAT repeat domain-containing protein [Tepidisphaeraceae bacterium]|nr:HEAT repeat domain-containing protein [Tepidisphaeraceae bacterium]